MKPSRLLPLCTLLSAALSLPAQPRYDLAQMQAEHLGRGVLAVRTSRDSVAVQWRLLRSDAPQTAFHVYRDGRRITSSPLRGATFFRDALPAARSAAYEVRPVAGGEELPGGRGTAYLPPDAPTGYIEIPLDRPAGGRTPDGQEYSYTPNDATLADTNGDGEMELILKWDPTNSKDNSQGGYTGNVYVDCYELLPAPHPAAGRRLWRIDLGRNIRAGAHYTQLTAYDFDGDGSAELVLKTADGTRDALGQAIGDSAADWRNRQGRVLEGPEYLTVFSGRDGRALRTAGYIPARGEIDGWGDDYGNRCDRFLAAVACLDGVHPSFVLCRGYYTRTVLAAFRWDGQEILPQWVFDTDDPQWNAYAGQGNHNLRVGDVDGDGRDEIIYGSMAVDHDGTGLYNTRLGHGDALHLTAFSPDSPALQVWACHENRRDGSTFREAATGKVLFRLPSDADVGRCMAADIDPGSRGVEMWSSRSGGLRSPDGRLLAADVRLPINMALWWDGDLLRELLDGTTISKYNPQKRATFPLLRAEGCKSNNGTKATPCLAADMAGDWREEVLLRTETDDALRLYVTPHSTPYRFVTFLQDPVYRLSVATQNVGYNQPSEPGFYFGPDAAPQQ